MRMDDGVKLAADVYVPTAPDRLRVDIYSADTPNHLALIKPALNTIYFGPGNDLYIALPVVPN